MVRTCSICGVTSGGLRPSPGTPEPEPWPEADVCPRCVGKPRLPDEAAEAIKAAVAKRRVSWLDVPEFFRLDWCCRSLHEAFGAYPYLVGSCTSRADYRDVDVSLMLPDEQFHRMFPNQYALLFLNAAVSDWLSTMTGLRIDFKFQDTTEANKLHAGPRNPLGIRAELYSKEPAK